MSNPPIEIRRGQGWPSLLWEDNLPILEIAAQQADAGLEALGLEFSHPKVATIRRVKSYESVGYTAGRTVSPSRLVVNAMVDSTEAQHHTELAEEWSLFIVHEAIHGTRMEYEEDIERFAEYVATEGLAYFGERSYLQDFCHLPAAGRFSDLDLEPDPMLSRWFKRLASSKTSISPEMLPFFNRPRRASTDIPSGALYGVQLINQQISNGLTFAELIELPTAEVLGMRPV